MDTFRTYQHDSLSCADITLNSILDLIVEGTWDWNGNTGHVDRSPGWYRMLGYEVGVFQKDVFTWENIIHPDDYQRVMTNIEQFISAELDVYCIEYRCKKADGSYLWIVDRAKIIDYKPDGTVSRIIGAHHNIHERKIAENELREQNRLLKQGNITLEKQIKKKAEELQVKNQELEEKILEIQHISDIDSLTGISNRKKFEEEIIKEIARAERYSHPLSVAMLDIDFFKSVNDSYGHKIGDQVLQSICQLITQHIRNIDFFARWGGEEFVLIFPDLSVEKAFVVTEKLRKMISHHDFGLKKNITCSFGLTEYQGGDSAEAVIYRVDELLYQAKDRGRNRVER